MAHDAFYRHNNLRSRLILLLNYCSSKALHRIFTFFSHYNIAIYHILEIKIRSVVFSLEKYKYILYFGTFQIYRTGEREGSILDIQDI